VESLELHDDMAKYLDESEMARNEGESDDDYNKRVQEAMEEANEQARDEAASNAEVDLSIE